MVLTWVDYAVIVGYLVAITAFGSWFARFQKTTRDYFLTDRSVPWWAICFTIVATETRKAPRKARDALGSSSMPAPSIWAVSVPFQTRNSC